jgi:hypothetical protein
VASIDLTFRSDANINHRRSGWKESKTDPKKVLVWAVNHGGDDITALMRNVIAARVFDKFSHDGDLGSGTTFLDGEDHATAAELANGLSAAKPAVVVTTSHGQTFPLDNVEAMSNGLGLLVDQNYASVQAGDLLNNWQPDGAVWYAHACCSAGATAQTLFEGLTEEGSEIDRVLKGVTQVGNKVAPLPTALLSAAKPLRAFVGHIEPTFDWTLKNPDTNQSLTNSLERALYAELYQPSPVGYAFRNWFARLGSLYTSYDLEQAAFSRGNNTRAPMLKNLLAARDVQSTVLLGDPTVMLHSL